MAAKNMKGPVLFVCSGFQVSIEIAKAQAAVEFKYKL